MRITKYLSSIKQKDKYLHTYFFLVFLRIAFVFLPQLGYIHPDEFFQSIEVITGDVYDLEHTRTWEFNNTFPIRSIAVPYFTIKLPLNLLQFLTTYTKYYLDIDLKCTYMFLVYPRLIMCILSFVNDWSLYQICRTYALKHEIRLMALGSSFVMLVFGTRTFSNTLEMALCSLLLYLVSDCMIHSNTVIYKTEFLQEKYHNASSTGEKAKLYRLKNALPAHSLNKVLLMSTLCVIGVFNRPTFLVFGAPIVFHWLLRGMGTKTITFVDFHLRMITFCLSAIPSILFFILTDSLYFMYLTPEEIQKLEIGINNFVFTPWNFIKYNLDSQNTASHGVHPRFLHFIVNIPLLYNILGVAAIFSFGLLLLRFLRGLYQNLPRSQSIVGLMTSAIFAPLAIMSLINHQEPRFLLAFTVPIILLHSPKLITGFCSTYPFDEEHPVLRFIYNHVLCKKASAMYLLKIWYTTNIALATFFGFIHQGGVYPLAQHFSNVMKMNPNNAHVHLFTSHIYNMPLTFVNIPNSNTLHLNLETYQKYRRSRQFFVHEYGSLDMNNLYKKIKLMLDICEMKAVNNNLKYQLYLAIPTSLTDDFNEAFYKSNNTIVKYEQIKVFYPHLSTEALPKLFGRHPCDFHVDEDDLTGTCDIDEGTNDSIGLSVNYALKQFSSIIHQFGLALYRFKVEKRHKH